MSSSPALPSDIIFNILLHLPVQTLGRFRCVSKQWSSLISSPFFRKSHLRRSEQNPLLFVATCEEQFRTSRSGRNICTRRNHIRTLNLQGRVLDHQIAPEQQPWPWPYTVAFSSCLDLVCFFDDDHVYIRNPTTREQITLPASPFISDGPKNEMLKIFHRQLAFAYIASESEYKVLQISNENPRMGGSLEVSYICCEVFTLGNECWRAVESPPFAVDYQHHMPLLDEAVYLLPYCNSIQLITRMARFDLKMEGWSVLPLPAGTRFHNSSKYPNCFLRRVGGRRELCMVSFHVTKKLDLWFLKDCNNHSAMEWVKEYCIDIPESAWSYRCPLAIDGIAYLGRWPLAIEEDGRVLLLQIEDYREPRGKLLFYDPMDGKFEEIFAGTAILGTCLYVESFMSLTNESFRSLKDGSCLEFGS